MVSPVSDAIHQSNNNKPVNLLWYNFLFLNSFSGSLALSILADGTETEIASGVHHLIRLYFYPFCIVFSDVIPKKKKLFTSGVSTSYLPNLLLTTKHRIGRDQLSLDHFRLLTSWLVLGKPEQSNRVKSAGSISNLFFTLVWNWLYAWNWFQE